MSATARDTAFAPQAPERPGARDHALFKRFPLAGDVQLSHHLEQAQAMRGHRRELRGRDGHAARRADALPWPVGPMLARNAAAESFSKSETSALHYLDPRRDRLELLEPRYRRLQFRPAFVQGLSGFKFVYLNPAAR